MDISKKSKSRKKLQKQNHIRSWSHCDNLKIIGLSETLSYDGKSEPVEKIEKKNNGGAIGATLAHKDICAAHKLSARSTNPTCDCSNFEENKKKMNHIKIAEPY